MNRMNILITKMSEHMAAHAAVCTNQGEVLTKSPLPPVLECIGSTVEGTEWIQKTVQRHSAIALHTPTLGQTLDAMHSISASIHVEGMIIGSLNVLGVVVREMMNENTEEEVSRIAAKFGCDSVDAVTAFHDTQPRPASDVTTLIDSVGVVAAYLSRIASHNRDSRLSFQAAQMRGNGDRVRPRFTMLSPLNIPLVVHALLFSPSTSMLPPVVDAVCSLLPIAQLAIGMLLTALMFTTASDPTLFKVVAAIGLPGALPGQDVRQTWGHILVVLVPTLAMFALNVFGLVAIRTKQDMCLDRIRTANAANLRLALLAAILVPSMAASIAQIPVRIATSSNTSPGFIAGEVAALVVGLGLLLLLAVLVVLVSMVVAVPPANRAIRMLDLAGLWLLIFLAACLAAGGIGAHSTSMASLPRVWAVLLAVYKLALPAMAVVVSSTAVVAVLWRVPSTYEVVNTVMAAVCGLLLAFSLLDLAASVSVAMGAATAFDEEDQTPVAAPMLVLLGLVAPLPFLAMAATYIRVRYAELLTFSHIFGGGADLRTKARLLRTAVINPTKRREYINRIVAERTFTLSQPDLKSISRVNLKIGVRSLLHPPFSQFGYHGITPEAAESLTVIANVLLSRGIAQFPDHDLFFRMVQLYVATMTSESITTAAALLQTITKEHLATQRPDHALYAFAMSNHLEFQRCVFALGGVENAAKYVEVEIGLSTARKLHYRALQAMTDFWTLLLRRNPDIHAVVHQAHAVGRCVQQAEKTYHRLFRRHRANPVVREWYAAFAASVLRDEKTAHNVRSNKDGVASTASHSVSSDATPYKLRPGEYQQRTTVVTMARSVTVIMVCNVLLLIVTAAFSVILFELVKAKQSVLTDIQDAFYATQVGALSVSMGHADPAIAATLYPDISGSLADAADTIQGALDPLARADGWSTMSVATRAVSEPSKTRFVSHEKWTVLSSIATSMALLSEADGSTEIRELAEATVRDNGLYMVAPAFAGMLGSLVEDTNTLLITASIVLGAVVVIQATVIIVTAMWLVNRSFTSIANVSDDSLVVCLDATRLQVKKQLRAVHFAKIRIKDFDADIDDFMPGQSQASTINSPASMVVDVVHTKVQPQPLDFSEVSDLQIYTRRFDDSEASDSSSESSSSAVSGLNVPLLGRFFRRAPNKSLSAGVVVSSLLVCTLVLVIGLIVAQYNWYGSTAEAHRVTTGLLHTGLIVVVNEFMLFKHAMNRFVMTGTADAFNEVETLLRTADPSYITRHVHTIYCPFAELESVNDISTYLADTYLPNVALTLAAWSYGFTTGLVDLTNESWNVTAETKRVADRALYDRANWYTNATADAAASPESQLNISKAVAFDEMTSEIGANIFSTAEDIVVAARDFATELHTRPWLTIFVFSTCLLLFVGLNVILGAVVAYTTPKNTIIHGMILTTITVSLVALVFVLMPAFFYSTQADNMKALAAIIRFFMGRYDYISNAEAFVFNADLPIDAVVRDKDIVIDTRLDVDDLGIQVDRLFAEVCTALNISLVLSAKATGREVTSDLDNYTWDVSGGRAQDVGRYTNRTYDTAQSDEYMLAMAYAVLTDTVMMVDFRAFVGMVTDQTAEFTKTIEDQFDAYATAMLVSTAGTEACLTVIAVLLVFGIVPTAVLTKGSLGIHRTTVSRRRRILKSAYRRFLTSLVAVVVCVTAVILAIIVVIFVFFTAHSSLMQYLAAVTPAAPLALNVLARLTALVEDRPAAIRHTAELADTISDLEAIIADLSPSAAGIIPYVVFEGTGAYTTAISALNALITAVDVSDPVISEDIASTAVDAAKAIFDLFSSRQSTFGWLVSVEEYGLLTVCTGFLCAVVLLYLVAMQLLISRLSAYSRVLPMMQSHLEIQRRQQ
ncbi:HAT repeat-containing protein [Carpediemonas membranifera]|uniref:HAT repeat-containing protein n=1 Tax=Carpediemonas membranifera TaxID=201153 RepID=A0A8J6ASE1_9EUKA|nr:HAT repeat-containing protein [Carpediemonas membranifera]|eukprot:KAG9390300.1 HAT repeat-containing protein [Carpediemonas membranifera]